MKLIINPYQLHKPLSTKGFDMENNLDKYFRDNLHGRKFEPKEEYWLAAEKLLEANEQRRKRRGFFWWFSGGVAVIGLMAIVFFVWNTNSTEQAKITFEPVQELGNSAAGGASNSNTISEDINVVKRNSLDDQANNNASKNQNQGIDINSVEPSIIEKSASNNSISQKTTAKKSIFNKKTRSSNYLNETNSFNKNDESTKLSNKEHLATISSNDSLITEGSSNNLPALTSEQLVGRISELDFLDIIRPVVKGILAKQLLETKMQKIDVKPQKEWHIHLIAMQVAQLQTKGEKTFLGQRMGIQLRRDLRGDWYVATGLQYHHRVGSFDASDLAQQRNYRFGLELDTIVLRPTSLHYATLPLSLGLERNKHRIEGGLLLDYLAGVRGEIGSYQKQGEPPVKAFKASKTGWMTKDGYNRFVPSAQFGYHYQIARRWSLGLNANYLLGSILKEHYELPINSFRMKETGKLSFSAQITYRIY